MLAHRFREWQPLAAMIEVPAVDLHAQHAALMPALEAAARRVLASGRFILGEEVAAFERELAAAQGVARAVALSSGTDALLALLMASDVGPGDEVVTTPLSFFATAEAIARVGAVPVFADVDEATLNLDPADAAARFGPRTRAALVVHLYGRAAETLALEQRCAQAGVVLLEDAAQALGARRGARAVGTLGRGAAVSFFPSKNLGGFGDGGAVLTDDADLADWIALLRVHGAATKLHHVAIGGNFRMDELQAALLRVKLPHLAAWTSRRRAVAAQYDAGLAGLPLRLPPPDPDCVYNQYVVRVLDGRRDALAAHLRAAGVATSVYYAVPLHLQPALAALGGQPGQLPRAEAAAAEVLALPMHAELSEAQVAHVVATTRAFY
jgi:dTDP-4-amino-4,6-dideoxygalactose transaminase